MATLNNRLVGKNLDGSLDPKEQKIGVHDFAASMREWQDNFITKQQMYDAYTLDASDDVQVDLLFDEYTNSADQNGWIDQFESVYILGERGLYGYDNANTVFARLSGA